MARKMKNQTRIKLGLEICEHFKHVRKTLDITQRQMASNLLRSQSFLSKAESGIIIPDAVDYVLLLDISAKYVNQEEV